MRDHNLQVNAHVSCADTAHTPVNNCRHSNPQKSLPKASNSTCSSFIHPVRTGQGKKRWICTIRCSFSGCLTDTELCNSKKSEGLRHGDFVIWRPDSICHQSRLRACVCLRMCVSYSRKITKTTGCEKDFQRRSRQLNLTQTHTHKANTPSVKQVSVKYYRTCWMPANRHRRRVLAEML